MRSTSNGFLHTGNPCLSKTFHSLRHLFRHTGGPDIWSTWLRNEITPALHVDEDIRALIQALPTKADIEALILRLDDAHGQELHMVRTEVQTLADHYNTEKILLYGLGTAGVSFGEGP